MRAVIERLSGEPVDRLRPLVAESERQGFRCVRRLVEEWTRGVNRFDRRGRCCSRRDRTTTSSASAG